MGRREFLGVLGSVTIGWSLAARAQQSDHMRRIAYLTTGAESDPEPQGWLANFRTSLREIGWIEGRNVRIDVRFGGGDSNLLLKLAKELIKLQPDVILAATTPAANAARQRTLSLPIVFVQCPTLSPPGL